jgi:aldehyde:ferredoxin oxidoreductase
MYGWIGKILHVNLNNSEVKTTSTQPYIEQYLGGRGIASRIYWETVAPEIKAFDPENRLIFMTGLIVATGAQAANRMSVIGKSPMTLPEGYCYGNIGGFFPAELKKAGFDGTIRRLTAQVIKRPWKQRIVDDLDMTFGTEMFGDFCKSVQHSNLKASDYFYGTGENIFYDKEKAQKQAEESKKTEKSKTEEK